MDYFWLAFKILNVDVGNCANCEWQLHGECILQAFISFILFYYGYVSKNKQSSEANFEDKNNLCIVNKYLEFILLFLDDLDIMADWSLVAKYINQLLQVLLDVMEVLLEVTEFRGCVLQIIVTLLDSISQGIILTLQTSKLQV